MAISFIRKLLANARSDSIGTMAKSNIAGRKIELARQVQGSAKREFWHLQPKKIVRQMLASGEFICNYDQFRFNLGKIAVWEHWNGELQVLEGQAGGWKSVRLGLLYNLWQLTTTARMHHEPGAKPLQPTDTNFPCLTLLHLIADRDTEGARSIAGPLEASVSSSGGPWVWNRTRLEPLALRVWNLWEGRFDTAKDSLSGMYRKIFDAWNGTDGTLEKALSGACDFHFEQSAPSRDNERTEFYQPLYDLFPIEILAIARTRERLGLSMPTVHHPLMDTPLAHPPDIGVVRDEILDELAKAAKEAWPNNLVS